MRGEGELGEHAHGAGLDVVRLDPRADHVGHVVARTERRALDAQGQLLGINTNRLGEGFYLAIPADEALRSRVDALARGESVRAPQLGIAITPGHVARRLRRAVGLPDTEGLLIRGVAEDSPAARAGLAPGDLIVAAAGQPVRTVDDLSGALRAAGETIELTVLRGTDERSIQVAFGQNSQPEAEA